MNLDWAGVEGGQAMLGHEVGDGDDDGGDDDGGTQHLVQGSNSLAMSDYQLP